MAERSTLANTGNAVKVKADNIVMVNIDCLLEVRFCCPLRKSTRLDLHVLAPEFHPLGHLKDANDARPRTNQVKLLHTGRMKLSMLDSIREW